MVDPDTGEPSRVMLKCGNNYDGYWTGEDVAKHLEEVHVIFLKLRGGDLALYVFDNSVNHHKIATDALNTKKLNLKDRGDNMPILRYFFYIDQNEHRVFHRMLTAEEFQKGLKTIILERVSWRDGMKKNEALALLIQKNDFDTTKFSSILDETVRRLAAWLEFVPKYHPEFNFIEMYWGYSKRGVRTKCDYKWEYCSYKFQKLWIQCL